jgi:hypothetical protein
MKKRIGALRALLLRWIDALDSALCRVERILSSGGRGAL